MYFSNYLVMMIKHIVCVCQIRKILVHLPKLLWNWAQFPSGENISFKTNQIVGT